MVTSFTGSFFLAVAGYFSKAFSYFGWAFPGVVFLISFGSILWIASSYHKLRREKSYQKRHSYTLTKLRDGSLFFDAITVLGDKKKAERKFDYIISLLPIEPIGQPVGKMNKVNRQSARTVYLCLYKAANQCSKWATTKGIAFSELTFDENLLYWYYRLRQEIIRTTVFALYSRVPPTSTSGAIDMEVLRGYEMQYLIPKIKIEEENGEIKIIHEHDREEFIAPENFKVASRYDIQVHPEELERQKDVILARNI